MNSKLRSIDYWFGSVDAIFYGFPFSSHHSLAFCRVLNSFAGSTRSRGLLEDLKTLIPFLIVHILAFKNKSKEGH
jgi:hypothetical protein